jgi:hypothetical protein
MKNFAWFETRTLALFALCLLLGAGLFSCKKTMNSGGGAAGDGLAGTGVNGTAGTTGTSGTAAAGTSAASGGTTGTAGETAGKSGGSGTGATAGTGASGTGATAGTAATAGTGAGGGSGTGATAGAGGSGDDPSVGACLTAVMAADSTITAITDCERCLCAVGNCQPELTALKDDAKGNAVVICGKTHMCTGACCVCGAECDPLGGNYGNGPCLMEVETAAGVTPGQGAAANGPTVGMNCDPTMNPPDNSCLHAAKLAKCTADKCKDMCPNVKTTCP